MTSHSYMTFKKSIGCACLLWSSSPSTSCDGVPGRNERGKAKRSQKKGAGERGGGWGRSGFQCRGSNCNLRLTAGGEEFLSDLKSAILAGAAPHTAAAHASGPQRAQPAWWPSLPAPWPVLQQQQAKQSCITPHGRVHTEAKVSALLAEQLLGLWLLAVCCKSKI